jgi:hypothetical protein
MSVSGPCGLQGWFWVRRQKVTRQKKALETADVQGNLADLHETKESVQKKRHPAAILTM